MMTAEVEGMTLAAPASSVVPALITVGAGVGIAGLVRISVPPATSSRSRPASDRSEMPPLLTICEAMVRLEPASGLNWLTIKSVPLPEVMLPPVIVNMLLSVPVSRPSCPMPVWKCCWSSPECRRFG